MGAKGQLKLTQVKSSHLAQTDIALCTAHVRFDSKRTLFMPLWAILPSKDAS